MKKLYLIPFLTAALLCSCAKEQRRPANDLTAMVEQGLAHAKTFVDTVEVIDGNFMGAFYNYNLHADPELSSGLEMSEVERGVRTIMSADTTQMSYLYGLQVGLSIMNTYRELGANVAVNKQRLMEYVMGAMRLDSVDRQQLLDLRVQFEQMDTEILARRQAEREAAKYNDRQAVENRMFADAYSEKLMKNPEWKRVGSAGVYQKVITPGAENEQLQPSARVRINYTISRLNGEEITSVKDMAIFAGRSGNPLVQNVIGYMHPGEKSEFFMPYTAAYGILGDPEQGIGLCESLLFTLEVTFGK